MTKLVKMLVVCGLMMITAKTAYCGFWDMFDDKPDWNFTPSDTLLINYADYDAEFVAICKENKDGERKCWLINWDKTKACLEKEVVREPKPTPTPEYYPIGNRPLQ